MKLNLLLCSLLQIFSPLLKAQNLVPNFSFESFNTCPSTTNPITYATDWTNPTAASPNYFNTCANPSATGIPNNGMGYQNAKSGGAYAGIFAFQFSFPNTREYIQVPLMDTLINGQKYCVSFYVSRANKVQYAINSIGTYFSQTPVSSSNFNILPYIPQIINTSSNPLIDTLGWTLISGNFIANGGEKYMTIGNFNTDATSDTMFIGGGITSWTYAYYFIDDVSVVPSIEANAGKDTTICKGNNFTIGTAAVNGVIYNWQPNAGLSNNAIAQPLAMPAETTTYTLTINDTTGNYCVLKTTDIVVVTLNSFNVDLGNDISICPEESIILDAGNPGSNYLWSNNNTTQTITINNPGEYWVSVNNSCTSNDTINVSTINCDTSLCGEVFIPNAFSPDGNSENDLECIYGNCIETMEFVIYNRWGEKVFETADPKHCWDGTHSGMPMNTAVFMYYFNATLVTGEVVTKKGNISLIR